MRRAAKVDSNSDEIKAGLLNIGAEVIDSHAIGRGFPDLVVAWCGTTFLLEIISPDAKPSRVREHEQRRAGWKGGPWVIVTTKEQALAVLFGAIAAQPGKGER